MRTNTAYAPVTEVDRGELDRQIANMYRDVANETAPDLHFPTERPIAQGFGYPNDLLTRLPAQAVNSFAGVGYHLGVARLLSRRAGLDLSGDSGMDLFAAATQAGPAGTVTGVDITPEQLAKADRLRRGQHARFLRARIEELPFDDGSVDAVIPNGVVNLSADKRRVFAEAARVLRPGGRLALADIVTEREIATPTARQAELWAACIAGASQIDRYLENIGAAGLQLRTAQTNPAYRFASERAQRTSRKYAAHSVSLLALKPRLDPDLPTQQPPRRSPSEHSHRHDPQRPSNREADHQGGRQDLLTSRARPRRRARFLRTARRRVVKREGKTPRSTRTRRDVR